MMDTIEAASQTAGNPPADRFFNLWRPHTDSEYPWTGIIFGAPILGIWYWCTDQYIVQRALSAKDISNARKGAIFAGFLKILPVFDFFIPGVIAYALHQKGAITFSMDNVDQALPAMITQILPAGIKGIAIAGLLAALMSSLSSAFNSSSTLLTIDFYQKYRPKADQKDLVRFGQMATIVLVILSLGWIPFMESLMGGGIFRYLQGIQANISPPIAAVFLFGLLYKWINGHGAIVALWTGFVIGMTRIVCEIMVGAGSLQVTEGSLLSLFLGINFLHFAFFLFILCAIILMVVSKMTTPQLESELALVTFDKSTRRPFQWSSDVTWTVALIVCVIIIWIVFSPLGIVG